MCVPQKSGARRDRNDRWNFGAKRLSPVLCVVQFHLSLSSDYIGISIETSTAKLPSEMLEIRKANFESRFNKCYSLLYYYGLSLIHI